MALATMILTPRNQIAQGGTSLTFDATPDGSLAIINGASYGWQNTDGCTELPGSALQDSAPGADGWGVSGATMGGDTIEEGEDGYCEFLAAVPFANPTIGYPEFGGRAFFAGLTLADAVTDQADFLFALAIGEGGVSVYEQGVLKGTFAAPRNNGRYYVGIESGVAVYRVDDQVIYRSDLTPEYPLYFGAIFFNRGVDQIGGVASSAIGFTAYDEAGNAAGSWSGAGNIWAVPETPGRYRIVAQGSDYLFNETYVYVRATWPNDSNTNNLPKPAKFRRLRSVNDYKVTEQVLDDQAALTNIPLPDAEPVRRWELTYTGLSQTQAAVFDDFFADHYGRGLAFYFFDEDESIDASNGYTWDNVKIESYESDHRTLRSNSQSRRVVLVRRPV